jgi:hypothetical protein
MLPSSGFSPLLLAFAPLFCPSVVPLRWVLIRDPQRQFRTQALLCTDLSVPPVQIVQWFILRWQLETTYAEVRAHLGIETPWTMLPNS